MCMGGGEGTLCVYRAALAFLVRRCLCRCELFACACVCLVCVCVKALPCVCKWF